MRLPAATLLALCACNQIYGLDKTKPWDAAPDAPDRQIRLSMLVGGTTDVASEAPPTIVDVTPDPKPEVALVDKPLVKVGYGAGGVVGYPIEFVGKQWRIEYTPQGSAPIEVQWSPADGAGHLVIPVVGRVERTKVPPGTGYALKMKKPDQTLFAFIDPVIYTTGYWSATPAAASDTLPVDFSVAPSMSGPAGAPSAAAKDVVVAIDYTTDATTSCRYTRAAGTAVAAELQQGAMTALELVRETNAESVVFDYKVDSYQDAQTHLFAALGTRTDVPGGRVTYGRLAHTALPAFTTTIDDVPAPLIIPLATCPIVVPQPPPVFDVGGGLSFKKGIFAFVSDDRMVGGVRLRSSIAAVGQLGSGISTYEATFDVPLATSVKLGADDLTVADGGLIAATPSDLTIGIEQDSKYVVDYFEVALYRLTANSLELVRTYVGTNPNAATIRFDPAVMMPNAEHVFAIRTYRGRPNARLADFSVVQGAQAVGTIFTRTFRR